MTNEYRAKIYRRGQEVATCKLCGINLYTMSDHSEPWPAVFPCGIEKCPYETVAEQAKIEMSLAHLEAINKT